MIGDLFLAQRPQLPLPGGATQAVRPDGEAAAALQPLPELRLRERFRLAVSMVLAGGGLDREQRPVGHRHDVDASEQVLLDEAPGQRLLDYLGNPSAPAALRKGQLRRRVGLLLPRLLLRLFGHSAAASFT